MEALSLLIIFVAIIGAIWLFDFDKPLRHVAEMANNQISEQHAVHKAKVVRTLAKNKIDAEEVIKAKEFLEQINSFDL